MRKEVTSGDDGEAISCQASSSWGAAEGSMGRDSRAAAELVLYASCWCRETSPLLLPLPAAASAVSCRTTASSRLLLQVATGYWHWRRRRGVHVPCCARDHPPATRDGVPLDGVPLVRPREPNCPVVACTRSASLLRPKRPTEQTSSSSPFLASAPSLVVHVFAIA